MKELESTGTLAESALDRALEAKPGLEVAKRIEELLQKLETRIPSTEELRSLRAVEVLENLATKDAKLVLEKLASGAEGAVVTREAKSALDRYSRARK
jgi:hypothetical protein